MVGWLFWHINVFGVQPPLLQDLIDPVLDDPPGVSSVDTAHEKLVVIRFGMADMGYDGEGDGFGIESLCPVRPADSPAVGWWGRCFIPYLLILRDQPVMGLRGRSSVNSVYACGLLSFTTPRAGKAGDS